MRRINRHSRALEWLEQNASDQLIDLGAWVFECGGYQEGRFMSHASSHDRYVDVGEWSGYPIVANVAWSCEFEYHSDLYAHHDRSLEGRARRNASCQTRRPAVATNASSSASSA
jgi:hypothetical protein